MALMTARRASRGTGALRPAPRPTVLAAGLADGQNSPGNASHAKSSSLMHTLSTYRCDEKKEKGDELHLREGHVY